MNQEDQKHLDLLSLFHYILAGILAVFACFPFIHVFIGLMLVFGKFEDGTNPAPPPFFGWMFVIMGGLFIVLGWTLAMFLLVTGRKLKHRRNRLFCMVIAGIECAFMPLGTVLGIFTILVLSRDSVKEWFNQQAIETGNRSE
ncbi:MAG: hypothetical protein BWY71_01416 [Planctomycetes bacterium ADurb.Bin412]|nr:MAG: hypothetical protein BWY71_01416 [Planctomycetes bacterium ADurb.Bin412]